MNAALASVTCARCSRSTTDPVADKWRYDNPPLVVQGVTLGLCWYCRTGETPPAESDEKQCDGSCSGDYRPAKGSYYEAVWGDSFDGEKFACWDLGCVETWAEEQDSDCPTCGHYVDVDITHYVDGKRVKS